MGDDIIELSEENFFLKNQIGSHDQKWLEESEAKLLKQYNDKIRANLITSRMGNQTKKNKIKDCNITLWLLLEPINGIYRL